MSWLEKLLERGNEAKVEPRRITRVRTVTPVTVDDIEPSGPIEIKHVTVQTSSPDGNYPGSVVVGYYSVQRGFVVMHDEHGKPTGKRMAAGNDPRRAAYLITRESWKAEAPDFNRRLNYQPLGIA